MPHRAYLRRPFAVLDAVRALRLGSTVRRGVRARRASAPRFGTRNNLNAIDCGKIGRSVVSSRIIIDRATVHAPCAGTGAQNAEAKELAVTSIPPGGTSTATSASAPATCAAAAVVAGGVVKASIGLHELRAMVSQQQRTPSVTRLNSMKGVGGMGGGGGGGGGGNGALFYGGGLHSSTSQLNLSRV